MDENLIHFIFFVYVLTDNVLTLEDSYDYGRVCVRSGAGVTL